MKFYILFAILLQSNCWAKLDHYDVIMGKHPSILFSIPYTSGVHEGTAQEISGTVLIDRNNLTQTQGELHVPLQSLRSGNLTRDCHLREALGLDYAISDFPKNHVCNDEHVIPDSGKNHIVFPEITFKITSLELGDLPDSFVLKGIWTIHGVSKSITQSVNLHYEKEGMRMTGIFPLSLKDFGIQVKPAKILFIQIKVKDQVKVALDLDLALRKK